MVKAVDQALTSTVGVMDDRSKVTQALVANLSVVYHRCSGWKIYDSQSMVAAMRAVFSDAMTLEYFKSLIFYMARAEAIFGSGVINSHVKGAFEQSRNTEGSIISADLKDHVEPSTGFYGAYESTPLIRALYWFVNTVEYSEALNKLMFQVKNKPASVT